MLLYHATNKRALPNPNVMFELGFAVHSLGWERVICVCNEEYGNIETQPFDISKHRIITYRKKDGEKKSAKSLSLTRLMNDIVSNYDNIVAKRNEFDYKKHKGDGAITWLAISTTSTCIPKSCRFSAISSPIKPPPTTIARFGFSVLT